MKLITNCVQIGILLVPVDCREVEVAGQHISRFLDTVCSVAHGLNISYLSPELSIFAIINQNPFHSFLKKSRRELQSDPRFTFEERWTLRIDN
ncbi:hypothetical protein L1887_20634 [Cichorium endivia]|nr:hypothetical protein L1887_20634 [Cichorium endivia]